MKTTSDFITVCQLATELGMDRSACLKAVKKAGVDIHMRRPTGARGQKAASLTTEQAEAFRALRREQGFAVGRSKGEAVRSKDGSFYAIAIVPDLDARRVKLGFAESVKTRLLEHQTAAPTAVLLRAWPCRRSWETAAIAALTRSGAKLIRNEVYEIGDVDAMLETGDAFFAMVGK
jgi:biotin operon repressor